MGKHGSITWLDFRPDDLTRARDLIKSLQDESVIDELGFLAVQTRFSDVFHPATSTQIRSARYLYFVAAIYSQLEREDTRSSEVAKVARERQDALRQVLSENEATGVIGRDAEIRVKQLPSTVYWSALRKLGMFTGGILETVYHSRFDELRMQRRGYSDDDKMPQGNATVSYWDPDLPPVRFLNEHGQVRRGTRFRLTKAEAQDLAKRYNTRFADSLLVHFLRRRLPGTDFPWHCPKPSDYLAVHLDHAQKLSLFARGVTLQYYQLVLEKRADLGLGDGRDLVAPVFAVWFAEARSRLKHWRSEELATLPTIASAVRSGPLGDRAFIDRWLARMSASPSAAALLADRDARELVRSREVVVKPVKARLKHLTHLKQWKVNKVSDAVYQFDYRHQIGTGFVREMLEGLESGQ